MMMNNHNVEVYLDASFDPNTQRGSWAAVIKLNDRYRVLGRSVSSVGQYQLPLIGAVETLNDLYSSFNVTIYSDNQNLVQGYNGWMTAWIKQGWKTYNRKPVKYKDDWQRLVKSSERHELKMKWVSKGDKTTFFRLAEEHAKEILSADCYTRTEPQRIDNERIDNALIPT